MARRVGDKPALGEVLLNTHFAKWTPDNLDERRAAVSELAGLAAEVGDPLLEAAASRWRGEDLLELGDIDAAERELATLERVADALHQRAPGYLGGYPGYLAVVARAGYAHLQGRLEDFEALAHEALALGLESHAEMAMQAFGAQMLALRYQQGRLGELVEAVRGFSEQHSEHPGWGCGLAWAYAQLDRCSDARRELDALARHDFADLPRDYTWLICIADLSDAVALLGDARRAEPLYQLLLPFADRCILVDGPICVGSASRPLGLLAATMGRFNAAARHFERALEMNAKIRSWLWVAHTQHDYAHTLLRRDQAGDRDKALTLLDAALVTADRLGLNALADKTRRRKHEAATASST
jgi:tetratricopeptide (TPR) repeat protein